MNSRIIGIASKNTSTVLTACVIIIISILVWYFFMAGAFSEPEKPKATGRITSNSNRRSSSSSKTEDEKTVSGGKFSLTAFEVANIEDDILGAVVAKVRPATVFIKAVVPDSGRKSSVLASAGNTKTTIGSGVIFNSNGYILTNFHVVGKAESIKVIPFGSNEETFPARIVKTDSASDLAVIKIETEYDLPSAVLGDSDLIEAGQTVLALGSPFSLEHTVTKGIISDEARDLLIDGIPYRDMIQTDAAINKGNSGGPLVNTEGLVVGINTAIYAPTDIFTGLGFAIPVNKAKELVEIISGGNSD